MKINNYLRFSMTLQDNQASTLYMNLVKLIALVVYDSKKERLNVYEILELINQGYDLEYADIDIVNAIKAKGRNKILLLDSHPDPVYNLYGLHPSERKRLDDVEDPNKALDEILTECIENNTDIDCDISALKELIIKFFYNAFNANKEIILLLINQGQVTLENEHFPDFTNQEKTYINTFLNWDNEKKYSIVFNAISCCFEYCMMVIKRDNKSFHDIFKGKVFYLDANIIFRLTGVNQHERKQIMLSFIDRCRSVGIEIRYTNITQEEIKTTTNYYIDGMRKLLKGRAPISTAAVGKMSPKYSNLGFYDEYMRWIKKSPLNKVGDYNSFKEYFLKLVDDVVRGFKFDAYESFEYSPDPDRFNTLCDDFKEFKLKKYKNAYESSIKTDINNYLYLQKKNDNVGRRSFVNVKYYIITADHSFTDWAKQRIVSVIPTVVLPSVWHSIILKYSGRSSNDYKAFSQFLVLRLNDGQEDDKDYRRKVILDIVLNLNESATIKEEIIYDIDRKLKNEYKEVQSVEEIVEASQGCILNEHVKQAKDEKDEEYKGVADDNFEKGSQAGYETGLKDGRFAVKKEMEAKVKLNTEKEIRWKYPVYILITIVLAALFAVIYVAWTYYLYNLDDISKNLEVCSNYILFGFEVIYALIFTFIITKCLKGLKRDEIKKTIYKKHYKRMIGE